MEFYSNGKLFILGEYYVLEGAKVFALPTKFGQYLSVFPLKTKVLSWKSYDADGSVWYNDEIAILDIILNNQSTTDKVRNTLIDILHQAHLMNPSILENNGFLVETKLTFPRNWGLGTSSTLINNIAQWFQVNAFKLLQKSFGGSGFDISCAQNNTPVTYQVVNNIPVVKQVLFNPTFKEHLYFVYLNKKRDSKDAIANFRKKQKNLTEEIKQVSQMTDELLQIQNLETFISFFKQYEQNLGEILETLPIQKQLFSDFKGLVKSLGGWGGDFVMVASAENPTEYFAKKGYHTILKYSDIIL
ncbi:GYDIA family GHMP kinase [Myroides sp. JBRI-B21084]|uniref:GYDIA family GHMP kinase n=1 Tax=Myroides sp. JBRI-B21084 TaxID=3119977 RepID=UPI0026E46DC9|nr:GYDIA family GHMP kinase [Paenimyroides cloacae]WKW46504.1 GYDIA family GHMP kinase [Paenimyroides cloacae]